LCFRAIYYSSSNDLAFRLHLFRIIQSTFRTTRLPIQVSELMPFFAFAIFLFGLAFGSFLNVVIYRVPRNKSVVSPRSACPACGSAIAAYDNIPIVSWMVLRGRCRNCKVRISPRYWLVELLTGSLFLVMFLEFGLSLATLKFCIFGFLLLGLIFIDAEHKLLPDKLTFTGMFVGLLFSWVVPVPQFLSLFLPTPWFGMLSFAFNMGVRSFLESLFAAAVSAALLFGVGELYFRIRGVEGMGFGDVKLIAMVGASLGLKLSLFVIFAGSVLGSVFGVGMMAFIWRKRAQRWRELRKLSPREASKRAWVSVPVAFQRFQIPFGVFLGSMAIASVFIGDPLMQWYWGFFR
jgi:leader peptidase (prepilin peptidase)/N-methyltransferase